MFPLKLCTHISGVWSVLNVTAVLHVSAVCYETAFCAVSARLDMLADTGLVIPLAEVITRVLL